MKIRASKYTCFFREYLLQCPDITIEIKKDDLHLTQIGHDAYIGQCAFSIEELFMKIFNQSFLDALDSAINRENESIGAAMGRIFNYKKGRWVFISKIREKIAQIKE